MYISLWYLYCWSLCFFAQRPKEMRISLISLSVSPAVRVLQVENRWTEFEAYLGELHAIGGQPKFLHFTDLFSGI
jgi:hypothetical protein